MFDNLSTKEAQDIKNARLLYYDFFYGLFVFELLNGRVELAKKQLEILQNAPLNNASEVGIMLLRQELENNGIQNIKEEFSRLFALPFGEKQVGMHLSHYYENCIGAQSLLKMRSLLKQSDVRVETSEFRESEEHLGFLFGFMRHLIESGNTELAKEVFLFIKDAYIGLISEIRARGDAKYYLALADILEGFMRFENDIYM
ncbi:TorD/DmsD family molecular chaperone [Helicobacter turcicus]|uniref:Molecular chaperone TorD family protein n=1 Tax=Helicobacter turcicus TaxID=2867412 RepID=A0ABS7JPF5_9HELI|nr:molecular chaperone TorD family protein [Helicobacter turcicus]MBX7491294.1 molecular chaperone TorD family protein [Helicobacter turcicus]MBX7546219.1 molecular chaperone TorD family protein [Helicobacter turcicus]